VVRRAGLRRGLTLPLLHDGRVLGLLGLGGTAARSWDGADLALAEELGRRIAVMLAADRLAQRSRQLQALTTALAAAESLADVTAALLAGVRSAFEATAMSVYRRDTDGRLVLVDAVGYPPELIERYEVIAPDAPAPLADCARTGELVSLRDLSDREQRYAALIGLPSWAGNRAAAAVPIRVGQRVVGAIGLSFGSVRDFPADEGEFALALAGQAGEAINRAQAPTNDGTSPKPCSAACYRLGWRRFPGCSWPRATGRTGNMSRPAATFMTRSPRLAAGRAWLATSVGRDRRPPRLPRCAATRFGRLR
jgi:GAF domain-containing protein